MIIVRIERNGKYRFEVEIELDKLLVGYVYLHIRDNESGRDNALRLTPMEAEAIGLALLRYAEGKG